MINKLLKFGFGPVFSQTLSFTTVNTTLHATSEQHKLSSWPTWLPERVCASWQVLAHLQTSLDWPHIEQHVWKAETGLPCNWQSDTQTKYNWYIGLCGPYITSHQKHGYVLHKFSGKFCLVHTIDQEFFAGKIFCW